MIVGKNITCCSSVDIVESFTHVYLNIHDFVGIQTGHLFVAGRSS
jgi:hypothetical protein